MISAVNDIRTVHICILQRIPVKKKQNASQGPSQDIFRTNIHYIIKQGITQRKKQSGPAGHWPAGPDLNADHYTARIPGTFLLQHSL
jgi:hypothetical protein